MELEQVNINWARHVLEAIRRWNTLGRQDPSHAAHFTLDGIRYTFRVVGGQLQVMADTKGFTEVDGNFGPVDLAERTLRAMVSTAENNAAQHREIRCCDCGALGYEWCPGCRSDVFPGRWGRNL